MVLWRQIKKRQLGRAKSLSAQTADERKAHQRKNVRASPKIQDAVAEADAVAEVNNIFIIKRKF